MIFDTLMEILNTSSSDTNACAKINEEMVEHIFEAGVYHGLFSKENSGFYDRENSVYCFIGTLMQLKEKKI